MINTAAAEWSKKYSYELIKGLTDTTRKGVQSAISDYYSQGLTMGDLEARLIGYFGPVRAEMIAVTEVTRASVQGELAVINQIQLDNPRIEFDTIWETNNDDKVCSICEPLNQTKRGEAWTEYPPAHVRCRCWVSHEIKK